jgi:NAD(P)-dependent dehydrogenase (short-subunit alcohol dehydrogenase family)
MAKQLTALGQPGEPEDIADVVAFLAGPDGAAVRGQVLRVDGCMAVGA